MKLKPLLVITLCLIVLGCSVQKSLKEQDAQYYTQLTKIGTELFTSFNSLTPLVKKYMEKKDVGAAKELEVEAEKFRKKTIELQKRMNKIEPTKGQESNHQYVIDRLEDFENFANSLIRYSGGDDDKLVQWQLELKRAYSQGLNDILVNAKNHKE
jgi:hypothetical protein